MNIDRKLIINGKRNTERGFSLIQLLIVVAIVSVVTSVAVLGITSARKSFRLSNSARQFAGYVERARADAVRRHSTASMQMLDTRSYSITMDFGGSGTPSTKAFSLENDVIFTTTLRTVTFDWRGRIPAEASIGFSNGSSTAN